jgi:hypothetical protein
MTTPQIITPRLGCANDYTVEVWQLDRRPQQNGAPVPDRHLVTQITGIVSLYWERTIDDFSEARVRFQPVTGDDCCGKLFPRWDDEGNLTQSGVWPWSHEIIIYRDGEPVWMGPIFSLDETVSPSETTDFVQINARDYLAWVDRRVIHETLQFGGSGNPPPIYDLVDIARQIVLDAFKPDNIGITATDVPIYPPSGRKGRRTTRAREARSGDELREVARGGIDFTAIGKKVIIKGVRRDPDQPVVELRNRDFQSGVEIRIVGAEAATKGYAVGQPPVEGDAPPPTGEALAPGVPSSGIDPFFGLIEALTNSSETTSDDFLQWMSQELVDENNPPPRTLSVPADSTLSPEANVSIHELIPSRHFKLAIKGTCSSLSQYMRLSHVEVTWEPGNPERVGVTFIPGNVEVGEETGG